MLFQKALFALWSRCWQRLKVSLIMVADDAIDEGFWLWLRAHKMEESKGRESVIAKRQNLTPNFKVSNEI